MTYTANTSILYNTVDRPHLEYANSDFVCVSLQKSGKSLMYIINKRGLKTHHIRYHT